MKNQVITKIKNNKGFTLVELIVVLVLISILVSITIIGGLGWQDWAQFKHENDVAEDIFYAAQNQLMELDASSSLDIKVVRELKRTRPVDGSTQYAPTMLMDSTDESGKIVINGLGISYEKNGDNLSYYNWDTVWTPNQNRITERGTLIRLTAEAGDYKKYLDGTLVQGNDTSKIGTKVLFDLISPYLSDAGVLNGAIALEFSPDAGQVFSVSYTDRHDVLAYSDTDKTASDRDYVSIMDRYVQYRRDNMIGYFSVTELAQKIKGRGERDNYLQLEIENGNLLLMKITDKGQGDEKLKPSDKLLFTIYDGTTYSGLMKFEVSMVDVNKITTSTFEKGLSSASEEPIIVDSFEMSEGTYKSDTEKMTYRLPIWRIGDDIYIVLDAADVQAQTLSYSESDAGRVFDSTKDRSFLNTFSFYRFGLAESPNYSNYIFADVKVQNGVDLTMSSKVESGRTVDGRFVSHSALVEVGKPKGECVSFEKYNRSDNTATIEIKNARHFYNIRYETDYKIDENRINNFNLKSDISWSKFIADDGTDVDHPERAGSNYFLNSYGGNDKSGNHIVSGIDYDGSFYATEAISTDPSVDSRDTKYYPFPSFRKLDKNDTFSQANSYDRATYKGLPDSSAIDSENKNYTIRDFKISVSANIVYGVYGREIKNLCVSNSNEDYSAVVGLESQTNDSTGSRAARAGKLPLGLFAENLGTIKNITLDHHVVKGLQKVNTQIVYACMVGGFAGNNIGTIDKLTLLDSPTSGNEVPSHINGRTDVGGIIGRESFVVKEKTRNVVIDNMINYASVSGMENIGGIIGRAYDGYFGEDFSTQSDNVLDHLHIYYVKGNGDLVPDENNYRYKFYHDGYEITDTGVSMSGENVDRASKITIKNCINRGRISGDEIVYNNTIDGRTNIRCSFIGGIAGITMDGIVTDSNEDYGNVTLNYSAYRDGTEYKMMIQNCSSFVTKEKYGLNKLTDFGDDTKCKSLKYDNYVGGLVGYGRATAVKNCNVKPDSDMMVDYDGDGSKEGVNSYVMGNRYVGGVFGCSDFCRYDKDSAGTDTTHTVTNYNTVIGRFLVGGIMGANGVGESSQRQDLTFRDPSLNLAFQVSQYRGANNSALVLLQNALNKGAVLALNTPKSFPKNMSVGWGWQHNSKDNKDYYVLADDELSGLCGGIYGMTRAAAYNCDNIQPEDVKAYTQMLVCGRADNYNLWTMSDAEYLNILNNSKFGGSGVGGIGGYIAEHGTLNKNIDKEETESHVDAVVFGKQYVGGALGLDTTQSGIELRNCYLDKSIGSSGALIAGRDVVGGLIGRSSKGFSNTQKITVPYTVRGRYGVGGVVGALTTGSNFKVTVDISQTENTTNNLNIYGISYVGGYVGVCSGDGMNITGSVNYANVEGKYFVGGIAGSICGCSNKHNMSSVTNKNVNLGDNVFVKANSFAGGVSGLYMVESNNDNFFKNSNDSIANSPTGTNETGNLIILADKIEADVDGADESEIPSKVYTEVIGGDVSADGINKKDSFPGKVNTASQINFSKDYNDNFEKMNYSNKATIEANIFAGGLFGYVPNGSNVTVKGFVNNGNIKTTATVLGDIVGEDVNSNSTIQYAYLGGVIGRVPSGMKLINCYNTKTGLDTNATSYYSSNATYMGGLTEVNAGVISGTGERDTNNQIKSSGYCKSPLEITTENISAGAFAGINGTKYTNGKLSDDMTPADDATGVIEYCYNIGNITIENSIGKSEALEAGGMAATCGGPSIIYGCRNDGDITSVKKAGGMVASTYTGLDSATFKDRVIMLDSVNVGTIDAIDVDSLTAGIIADTNKCGRIELCRNYGRITGNGTAIYGIVSDEASTVKRNLEAGGLGDSARVADPVAPKSSTELKRNFYIGDEALEENIDENITYNNEGKVWFTLTSPNSQISSILDRYYDRTENVTYSTVPEEENTAFYFNNSNNATDYDVTFQVNREEPNRGVAMKNFTLVWSDGDHVPNLKYVYYVTYKYLDKNGVEKETLPAKRFVNHDSRVVYDTIPAPCGDEVQSVLSVNVKAYYDELLEANNLEEMSLYYWGAFWTDTAGIHYIHNAENKEEVSIASSTQSPSPSSSSDGLVRFNAEIVRGGVSMKPNSGSYWLYNTIPDASKRPSNASGNKPNYSLVKLENSMEYRDFNMNISVDSPSTGLDMKQLKIYWLHTFASNGKEYKYTVSFTYYDNEGNRRTVYKLRSFTPIDAGNSANGTDNRLFCDVIPVTNINDNPINPVRIGIQIDYSENQAPIWYYSAVTWVDNENMERIFTDSNNPYSYTEDSTNGTSYVKNLIKGNQTYNGVQDDYSEPGGVGEVCDYWNLTESSENITETEDYHNDYVEPLDYWSKRLDSIKNTNHKFNLSFKTGGNTYRSNPNDLSTYRLLSVDVSKALSLEPSSTYEDRVNVMNSVDKWFVDGFVDNSNYPDTLFVPE